MTKEQREMMERAAARATAAARAAAAGRAELLALLVMAGIQQEVFNSVIKSIQTTGTVLKTRVDDR